jgi:hypothetical protein
MDSNNASGKPSGKVIGMKSWVAYVHLFFCTLLFLMVGFAICFIQKGIGIAILLLTLAGGVYTCFVIRSYRLVVDRTGVWIFSGVLPWTKGFNGVKWRDLDEAVFCQSFVGWLTKSYTIQLTHRFTKTNEIRMTHTAHGSEVVAIINGTHNELLKAGTATQNV